MRQMRYGFWIGLLTLSVLVSTMLSAHEEGKKADDAASRKEWIEHHEKMAEAHRKMVECLKSDKPTTECKEEMKKAHAMKGEHSCACPECGKGEGKCSCGHEGASCPHHPKEHGKRTKGKGKS